jgi:virginiamycin B lyase
MSYLVLKRRPLLAWLGAAALPLAGARAQSGSLQSWKLATSKRTGIHDVAPAPDGGVFFSAQASGHLGWFEPATGRTELVPLGSGSAPHGVIQGPDHAAWLTDGGQNAIVRVGWPDGKVSVFPLPRGTPYANLNTCTFDGDGDLWFTGQGGYVGKLAVRTGLITVKAAPRGRGPYGICTTPAGEVWWCSLANSYIAHIDRRTGDSRIVEPPTKGQGARRIWSDSRGRLWISEWNSGQLSMHDPGTSGWHAWKVPGPNPMVYAVYVDERDRVWVSDFGGNAVWSFDPRSEKFEKVALPRESGNVRQILGRKGEVWLGESGTEHITVIRTASA